jgi:TPP-dependent pyruvate/acetoin dehydrogenase alpha subunit
VGNNMNRTNLATAINCELAQAMYYRLLLIREVELRVVKEFPTDKIKSPIHTSIGQEFVSVGVCEALIKEDIVFGTYRGHALYLAKGGDLNKMIAELYGKKAGCAGGKAGSMHLIDKDVGMMGTSAIVAASIPHAVGYAMAMKYRKQNSIVVCFFGEGATDEGAFYEAVNFASLKQLPILFVCENNSYAIYSKQEDRSAGRSITEKVAAFGLDGRRISGGDMMDVYEATNHAVNDIRNNSTPFFLEVETYRWYDHVGPDEDWELGYRTKEEAEFWKENDQLDAVASELSCTEVEQIEKAVFDEIERAFKYAEGLSFPAKEDLLTHVYA